MRILVVGAGATGGYFGARLLAKGRDVTFLVRERRAAMLRERGLIVHSPVSELNLADPPLVLSKDIAQPFDLVILSCKAYDLPGAIESFAPAVGPDTAILPLLNGMAHLDALDARFDPANVLGGQCSIAATVNSEGEIVQMSSMHTMVFGERAGGRSLRVEAIEAQLGDAGFDLTVSEDVLQSMWDKWVFLATLATGTCLMRAPIRDILAAPGGEEILKRLFMECENVAADNDHPPSEATIARARSFFGDRESPMTASMLRDLENGAAIEADHIVGDLIARRRSKLEGASMLELAYAHLKAYESRRAHASAA
ncbi:2-dehydropantoate 2-reductase [Candidatus Burkholderia verschuerenii]|uniref:2-dehydropantoate 2-reductase n=1 Tax=Candidatus Burkholderia verschuerenii TaxID=242163 RepID=A0A0L0M7S0_9BURK|nr:2-dehydropantoate 2-reductase [Candidatus Burkholderia verschuerenii]KND58423.1 2-dehydropantoate 2-reductase [Candidatus Burkholderia verschuerenii]